MVEEKSPRFGFLFDEISSDLVLSDLNKNNETLRAQNVWFDCVVCNKPITKTFE